jgi:hypothetical protein
MGNRVLPGYCDNGPAEAKRSGGKNDKQPGMSNSQAVTNRRQGFVQ